MNKKNKQTPVGVQGNHPVASNVGVSLSNQNKPKRTKVTINKSRMLFVVLLRTSRSPVGVQGNLSLLEISVLMLFQGDSSKRQLCKPFGDSLLQWIVVASPSR